MGLYKYIEKENYSDIRQSNKEKIQKIYENINTLKIKNELSNIIEDLIACYEKLFEYKNTNEEDFLNYLILYHEKFKKKQIEQNEMQAKLDIYGIFISDENFIKNFP